MIVAVLAGRGHLPVALYGAMKEQSIPFVIVRCDRETPVCCDDVPILQHHSQWGKVGALLSFLKAHRVTHIVMAGAIDRPNHILDLKVDWVGLKWLKSLRHHAMQGDNSLLTAALTLLEQEGFKTLSTQSIMPPSFARITTRTQPQEQHLKSIATGRAILEKLSPYDIGQALGIAGERVLGVEGPEGTDALIQRCAPFIGQDKAILVKTAKVGQSHKVDVPTIGPQTIHNLAQYHFTGIAYGPIIHVIEPEEVAKVADEQEIFLFHIA